MAIHMEEGEKAMFNKRKKASKNSRERSSLLHDRSLVLNDNSAFSVREEYKTLRTNIMFSIPAGGCKIIGVSSAQPLEGKSINCLNLAITFAEMNARVLLVDCDLRLPTQARLNALDAIPGISNVLVNMNSLGEAIKKTHFPNLDVLLSGDIPPNPNELLGSKNMSKLIEQVKNDYDYIFIDLPPINVVSDVMVVSKYLSGMILIMRSGVSKRDNVMKAINKLEIAGTHIIGVVLTDVKDKSHFGKKYGRYDKNTKKYLNKGL